MFSAESIGLEKWKRGNSKGDFRTIILTPFPALLQRGGIVIKYKFLIDIAITSKGFGLWLLVSDRIGESVIIRDDEGSDLTLQEVILFKYFQQMISFIGFTLLQIIFRDWEVDEQLIRMKSFSDRQMPKKSLMCLLIIDRQSRLEAQLFDASKYLVRSFRYKATTLYIYDLTKLTLFMKSDAPIR